ncbi:hypothetical protein SH2C18_35660 [Clostridium sediminicola]|uniref:flavodoxin family protein n=1 Tax=Clostridium sediminicola TaxID=3114879 RepID=UPI0031F1D320
MKTVVIKECESITIPNSITFDLTQMAVKNCIGCWSCWWKTPGVCTYKDLDVFYHEYITADKAIYFSKVIKGFVSGNLKTLFDRMIPLYLPYVTYKTGESMHVPRYENYPDIEFYYEGEFETDASRQIFVDYIRRVFYQFYSKNIIIKPIKEFI